MQTVMPCSHKVQYYETDAMQIVHHSNYIRWMEEARLDYLEQVNLGYDKIEARGMMIPVLHASCDYRQAVRFGETVIIDTRITGFNGLKFQVAYEIFNEDRSILHAAGKTEHCFLDQNFRPVRLKRQAPDIYEYFNKSVA